jgi:hypothetical protein
MMVVLSSYIQDFVNFVKFLLPADVISTYMMGANVADDVGSELVRQQPGYGGTAVQNCDANSVTREELRLYLLG